MNIAAINATTYQPCSNQRCINEDCSNQRYILSTLQQSTLHQSTLQQSTLHPFRNINKNTVINITSIKHCINISSINITSLKKCSNSELYLSKFSNLHKINQHYGIHYRENSTFSSGGSVTGIHCKIQRVDSRCACFLP